MLVDRPLSPAPEYAHLHLISTYPSSGQQPFSSFGLKPLSSFSPSAKTHTPPLPMKNPTAQQILPLEWYPNSQYSTGGMISPLPRWDSGSCREVCLLSYCLFPLARRRPDRVRAKIAGSRMILQRQRRY